MGGSRELVVGKVSQTDPIRLIGYWGDRESEGLIDPRLLVADVLGADVKAKTVGYLRKGQACGGDLGWSWCRFECGIADSQMGSAELTDGCWGWPEGLAHYVDVHDVVLPEAFYAHMESRRFTIDPNLRWQDQIKRAQSLDDWREWCRTRVL